MKHLEFGSGIAAISQCALACHACAGDCLAADDVTVLAACIGNNLDCAALCSALVAMMARGSPAAVAAARACADACRLCADECEKHTHAYCRNCAAACREALAECEAMAAR